jgi:hypothetical protein
MKDNIYKSDDSIDLIEIPIKERIKNLETKVSEMLNRIDLIDPKGKKSNKTLNHIKKQDEEIKILKKDIKKIIEILVDVKQSVKIILQNSKV